MALNEIYTSWKVIQLDDNASMEDKLQIMVRGAKTLALRAAIAKRIDKHQKQINAIELFDSILQLCPSCSKRVIDSRGTTDWENDPIGYEIL